MKLTKLEIISSLISFAVGTAIGMLVNLPVAAIIIMLLSLVAIRMLRNITKPENTVKEGARQVEVLPSYDKKIKATTTYPPSVLEQTEEEVFNKVSAQIETNKKTIQKISKTKIDKVMQYFYEDRFVVKDIVAKTEKQYKDYLNQFSQIHNKQMMPTKSEYFLWAENYK